MKKQLNYIVSINEAFDSNILGKTMAFINKDSRSAFINILNKIAKKIDMPISKYSDEYFQYLPFKRALKLSATIEDSPCDAMSSRVFSGEFGIDGETCQSGRIRRKWGTSTRMVECPRCEGSGVKSSSNNSEPKWIKFWFDKDGNFVNVTVTDGKLRTQGVTLKVLKSLIEYRVVRNLNKIQTRELPMGSIVNVTINRVNTIGVIWRQGSKSFVIQNVASGGEPSGREWKKYGEYSWDISEGDMTDTASLLEHKTKEDKEEEKEDNPYTWNAPLVFSRYDGDQMEAKDSSDVEKFLSNAHFALVLDYKEFLKTKFIKKSITIEERELRKKDVLKFKKDDEIKKENILRYLNKLSDNVTITEDYTKIAKLIPRILGWTNCGIYVLTGRGISRISDVMNYTYGFLKTENEYYRRDYLVALKDLILSINKSNIEYNEQVADGIKMLYKNINENPSYKSLIPVIDKFFELNKTINDVINNIKIETLEDIEILYQKTLMIRNMWKDGGERMRDARRLYSFVEYIRTENAFHYLRREMNYEEPTDIEKTIDGLDRFIRIIKKI